MLVHVVVGESTEGVTLVRTLEVVKRTVVKGVASAIYELVAFNLVVVVLKSVKRPSGLVDEPKQPVASSLSAQEL